MAKLEQNVWYSGMWEEPGPEWWSVERPYYARYSGGTWCTLCSLSSDKRDLLVVKLPPLYQVVNRLLYKAPVEIGLAETLSILIDKCVGRGDLKYYEEST